MSHRPAARLELFLHVGAEHARLDVCQPGLFVDGEHPVHPPQVHRDHLPLLAGFGLQGGDDVGAATERDHDRVGRHHRVDDPRHLVLVGGIDHHVGQPAELAGAHPHQVAHPLPEAVDDAGLVIGLHVLGAGDPDQGITQFRFQARCRNLQVRELRHRGDRLVDVDADQFLHEGGELRFVVVMVRTALLAPTPPLVLLDAVDHWSSWWSCWSARARASSARAVTSVFSAFPRAAARAYSSSVLAP